MCTLSKPIRPILVLLAISLFGQLAQAKYGGGIGTADDPYQIATAADLIALGDSPEDYDKHFILTDDIDLDPNLPGRKVFDKAVIAPGWATPFTGVFDGNGHTISHLTIKGWTNVGLFCSLASGAEVKNLRLFKPTGSGGNFLVDTLEDGTVSNCYVQDCNLSIGPTWGTGGLVRSNAGAILDCHISGQIIGSQHAVGGLVAWNEREGTITRCSFSGSVRRTTTGTARTGGLVGDNAGGISFCYSTGSVSGRNAGGLVGSNSGVVYSCYSTSSTGSGEDHPAGGLVGSNRGIVSNCYSAGGVSGERPGGLVGFNYGAPVTGCFWDMQASGQTRSAGGTGKTTTEMQNAKTFLEAGLPAGAGWDFVGESQNGTEDIWAICEGNDYPRLRWQYGRLAFCPDPWNGTVEISGGPILWWAAGGAGFYHDVYFGEDEAAVADATSQTQGIYRRRQAAEMTTYDPGVLKFNTTYYWRIDEVTEGDPNGVSKGEVWSFTTDDFVLLSVLDDFESYSDNYQAGQVLPQTWISGLVDQRTGSVAGPFAERTIIHGGKQSMPFCYDNTGMSGKACYSEAQRTWETPQDWTVDGADTLTLYFRGDPNNGRDSLYVAIEDSAAQIAVVTHPDADAVLATEWQKWHIALAGVRAMGVDVTAVKKMVIGVGDRDNPQPGGTGRIYIDDIRLTWRFLSVDFDGDMDTDFLDFCILAEHWLQSDSSFYCGAGGCDLTNDGLVNYEDLMELAENWLCGRQ